MEKGELYFRTITYLSLLKLLLFSWSIHFLLTRLFIKTHRHPHCVNPLVDTVVDKAFTAIVDLIVDIVIDTVVDVVFDSVVDMVVGTIVDTAVEKSVLSASALC